MLAIYENLLGAGDVEKDAELGMASIPWKQCHKFGAQLLQTQQFNVSWFQSSDFSKCAELVLSTFSVLCSIKIVKIQF